MTREAAIKIIKECKEKGFKHTFYTVNEYDAALDMAINALRRDDTFLGKVLKIIDRVGNRAEVCDMDAYEVYTEIRFGVLALKGEQNA